ncbi:MAG: SNF2 family helicase [Verrucomicrobiales bacterium]|nr:SNF2 family helicase [Verrucomicrobiales bacterium]
MNSTSTSSRKDLTTVYNALPDDTQQILQLLSVAIEVDHMTAVLELVKLAALHSGRSKSAIKLIQIKNSLKTLLKEQLIEQKNSSYHVSSPISTAVVYHLACNNASTLKRMANAIRVHTEKNNRFFFDFNSTTAGRLQTARDLKVAYMLGDAKELQRLYEKNKRRIEEDASIWDFSIYPLIPALFPNLPNPIRLQIYTESHFDCCQQLFDNIPIYDLIAQETPTAATLTIQLEYLIFKGQFTEARELTQANLSNQNNLIRSASLQALGWLAFIQGDDDQSIDYYEQAFTESLAGSKRRKAFPYSFSGLFFLFALCRRGKSADLNRADTLYGWSRDLASVRIHNFTLTAAPLIHFKIGNESIAKGALIDLDQFLKYESLDYALSRLLYFYVCRWVTPDELPASDLIRFLKHQLPLAQKADYSWLESLYLELLIAYEKKPASKLKKQLKSLQEKIAEPYQSIVDLIPHQEKWERSLNALEILASKSSPSKTSASEENHRIRWVLDLNEEYQYDPDFEDDIYAMPGAHKNNTSSPKLVALPSPSELADKPTIISYWTLQPFLQKKLKSGKWGKARPSSFQWMDQHQDVLAEQDKNTLNSLSGDERWGRQISSYSGDKALSNLCGHSHLYNEQELQIELVLQEPELRLAKEGTKNIHIQLYPEIDYEDPETTLVKDTPTRFLVVPIEASHCKVAKVLGSEGLTLPRSAKDRALESLASLSSNIRVQSQIASDKLTAAQTIAADTTLRLHLFPLDEGLLAELYLQPIPPDGDHFHPGEGGRVIFARGEKNNIQATRDLEGETQSAHAFITQCPTLAQAQDLEQPHTWTYEDPEASLNLLVDLQQLPAGTVEVMWPKGEAFNLRSIVTPGDFKLKLKEGKNNWLEASGALRVDQDLVLGMREIMQLLEQQPGEKFIQLKDGQFLALGKAFRQKLDDLRLLSTANKGKTDSVSLHPLAALALEELADDKQNSCSAGWKKRLKKLKEIKNFNAKLPTTLQAELRPYQLEGFQWLARLAEWGAGACLADDMGLGKTVQALALLLHRAKGGPALIVAPTSVAANWINETLKFAPTLNPIRYAGKQSAELLKKLKARDMVITTYGMLQQEDTPLTAVEWHTVVLDEAQAIKNHNTKRAKAAKQLQAGFCITTTGTPIENHLGELHSLFDFINPGLLGSADSFRKRFADPIEIRNNEWARNSLRRIVQPFILRRLKSEVLLDLPPRTEITLEVEMSPEETVFYEALRQNAVEALTNNSASSGEKSFQILAEIMRLRQACCNPSMVQKKGAPASSKLQVFTDTVTEIIEGGHKVLVFSQFVKHLALLKKRLEKLGISYQYLDGSVPAKKRQQSIDAFQNGEGDVFLISLKAGGSGLNLTAADYVIHMDPWWNPAVEDQASDRAHRIGQQRPVTIYRLVTKNTIEEKIVALHHQKRDLADSLLAGTDQAARLSAEDMLQLIQDA